MYRSWWFQLLIIFLTINVVVCSLERLPKTWKVVSVKVPPFNVDRFRSDNGKVDFQSQRSVQTFVKHLNRSFVKNSVTAGSRKPTKVVLLFGEKGAMDKAWEHILFI
jgi:cytochrome c biogenesis protein